MSDDVGGVESGWELSKEQWIGLIVGLVLFGLFQVLPPIDPITPKGMRGAGLFILFACWLFTTPLPMYAVCFLVMGLAPLLGVIEMKTAMAHFGSWINLFLLGAFVLGRNLDRTQAARRLALWVCSLNIMKHRPWTFFTIFTLVTCVSPVLLCSSIVATVVFTTIGISFFEAIGVKKGDKFGSMFVLAVTWAATAGSMIFAWGTVINLFAMGVIAKQTGYQLGMLEWTYYGVIAAGVSYLMFWLVCRFVARIDVTQMKEVLEPVYILEERKKLGPMNSGEKASIIVMCVAIFLWFLPEIFSIASPGPTAKWLKTHLTWPTTALVLAAACTLIPVKIGGEKRMLLNWPEWTKSVEWGVLAIIAAGLILGDVLSDNTTGIPQFFMDNLGALVKGGGGEYILLFLVVGLGCLMTECMSNFGLIAIFIPLAMSISTATGVGNPVAIAICATAAYNQSFALPLSPVMAIAFGSGWVNPKDAIKYGFLLDALVGLGLAFIAYPLLKMIIPM